MDIIKRPIFFNRRNGQTSLTLPSEILKQLEVKDGKMPKKLYIKIFSPDEVKDIKLVNK
jgi:hypothetical protein